MRLLFLDTECTGIEEEDRLCEVAWSVGDEIKSARFKPPLPIKVGAMAVHHITNKDVENCPTFIGSEVYSDLKFQLQHDETVMVAHNAKYDVGMLLKEGIRPKNVICTLKIAKYLDTKGNIESYALQYLRYLLGLEVDAGAHDALGDVKVLVALFPRLYAKVEDKLKEDNIPFLIGDDVCKEMIRISNSPILLARLKFGKHVGRKFEDVVRTDRSYLDWLLKNENIKKDADEDLVHTIRYHLYHSASKEQIPF